MPLVRYLTHRLVLLSLLVSLGIAGLLARNLWVVHENALASAELANRNLSHTLAVGLQWVLAEVDHDILQVRNVLQHRDHKTWDMHAVLALSGSELLVLDEYGDGVRDMVLGKSTQPLGQRDFFQALRQAPQAGVAAVAIGSPQALLENGPQVLPIARAWYGKNGHFAGAVVASLPIARLEQWLSGMEMGAGSAINIIRRDGQVLLRFPQTDAPLRSLAGSTNFQRYIAQPVGVFVAPSVRDGITRIHSFEHVAQMPLLVNVVQAKATVLHSWYRTAWSLGSFSVLLVLGNLGLALLFTRELERRRRAQQALRTEKNRMQHMALHDALTGLPNRLLLKDRVEQAMAAAQRDGGTVGLLYLDLDGFKQVNDRWGHEAGDCVLLHIAQQLQQVARGTDTVCRLGGDEFVLLLPECTLVDVQQIATRVLAACAAPCWWHGEDLQQVYSISGGVSMFPEHGTNFSDLLRHADSALYQAKEAGRGQVVYYQAAVSS